ncbi:MAG: hypothetical protein KBD65_02110 [Candidatus Moranbacteria bacterium]|nr:hypothetical protein [Candidatus Moranbacteria bacterium]
MQKKSLILVVAVLILVGGVVFVWQKNLQQDIRTSSVVKTVDKENEPANSSNTSGLKTYKNTQLGFEFNYPEEWTLREVNQSADSDIHPDWIFRYVVLQNSKENFKVILGVKDKDETSVHSRSWTTGIPAGEFQDAGKVSVDGGFAQKRRLVYSGSINNYKDEIQLVWYCEPEENVQQKDCKNFSLSKNKSAFVGISNDVEVIDWQGAEETVDSLLQSLHIL